MRRQQLVGLITICRATNVENIVSPSSGHLQRTGNLKMGWSRLPWVAERASPTSRTGISETRKALEPRPGFIPVLALVLEMMFSAEAFIEQLFLFSSQQNTSFRCSTAPLKSWWPKFENVKKVTGKGRREQGCH